MASVVYVDVNRRSVPVPRQALYDVAADLRSATEARVAWEDCASAVALVLSAMERDGLVTFHQADDDIQLRGIEGTPSCI